MLECSYAWLNDPVIQKMVNSQPVTHASQREWFSSLHERTNLLIRGIHYLGNPIGVFGLKNIAEREGEYWGYIGNKSYWGQGIGKWMMTTAIHLAKEHGVEKIYLKVLSENSRALNLYLQFGFKPVQNLTVKGGLQILEKYL